MKDTVDISDITSKATGKDKYSIYKLHATEYHKLNKNLLLILLWVIALVIVIPLLSFLLNIYILDQKLLKNIDDAIKINEFISLRADMYINLITKVTSIVIPLLTLIVGYIFGKKNDN